MTKMRSSQPEWLAAYQAALLEVDKAKVMQQIAVAEEAIGRRLKVDEKLSASEAQAIYDAIVRLRLLWHEASNR